MVAITILNVIMIRYNKIIIIKTVKIFCKNLKKKCKMNNSKKRLHKNKKVKFLMPFIVILSIFQLQLMNVKVYHLMAITRKINI